MTRRQAIKLAGILLIVGASVAVALLFPVGQWLEAFSARLRALGIWGPILYAAVYVLACVFLVPASWLTLGAGYAFGTVAGAVCAISGALVGASLAFVLGRTLAREMIERRIADSRRFAALDHGIAREGFRIVLLVRLSPVLPFGPLNYALGITKVSFRDFFLASLVGMIPGSLMYAYLGWATQNIAAMATGEAPKSAAQWTLLAVGLLATVAIIVLLTRVARRALREVDIGDEHSPPR